MSDIIKHATTESFDADVLQADKPVLVDYWAPWCGPCKMIAPILDDVASEFADKVQVVKVDVDQNPDIATKFGIRGIPTLMLFNKGQSVATKVGAVNKTQLVQFIESNI
ncbi:thioredoxin TrxA [Pelistega europaea]|uniref:Thioredoxin n=1 Tax=Pelistega europaea TaxID=106147 RepID=A0A7Y4L9R2_9BURK|nr:thioredoxin TrxA [Pelistega europaea]NOL49478.1 thioredoxin TrxA [Pelistega europaea]